MWIVFEGLDKSGKGTLEWEVLKATNFKHIIIDRGPAGYVVFDKIFERSTEEGLIEFTRNISLMKKHRDDFVVVYCKVPVDIAMQRLKEHNETCPYDYEIAQEKYNKAIEVYKVAGLKVITVDTTKSIEECVELILGGLK